MRVRTYTAAQKLAYVDGLAEMREAGGPPAWTPALAGGKLWLKADTTVVVPATSFTWTDKTGTGNDFLTTGAQPTVVANQVNGKPVVRFAAGVDTHIHTAAFTNPGANGELWAVLKMSSATSNGGVLHCGSDTNGTWYPFSGDGNIYDSTGSTSRPAAGAPVTPVNAFHVVSIQSAANLKKMWLNGAAQYSSATNTVGWGVAGDAGSTRIVIAGDAASAFAGVDIAELWLGPIMSAGDRALTKTYITAQYGLAVAAGWT